MVSEHSSTVELENRFSAGTYKKRPLAITHGEGAFLFDESGSRFIDCIGGIGAALVGHAHPVLRDALADQVSRVISVPELLCSPVRAQYQERVLQYAPKSFNRVFLCNSGAEANEAAFKLSRMAASQHRAVALARGFHGKTLGALGLTHDPKYREPFFPLLPDIAHVASGDLEAFREAVKDGVGAFAFEAFQGEGGVREHSPQFIQEAMSLTRAHGGFVIADEVQCGFGRTGKMWGFEHLGVEPDIICTAKGIGGGVPLGAILIHKDFPILPPLSHTTTYGGNPLSCRAGLAVLEIMEKEKLIERAARLGVRFRERFSASLPSCVREVRGQGLMIGIELKKKAGEYLEALQEKGILALLAGPRVLRLLPPLVIEEDTLDFVAASLQEVLSQ